MNSYYNPVRILNDAGTISELPSLLKSIVPKNGRVLLLVWHESVAELKAFADLHKDYALHTICCTFSNPTVEQLFALYCETKDFCPEAVVDPELTKGMPVSLAVSSALDAATQKMNMKAIALTLAAVMGTAAFTGCSGSESAGGPGGEDGVCRAVQKRTDQAGIYGKCISRAENAADDYMRHIRYAVQRSCKSRRYKRFL